MSIPAMTTTRGKQLIFSLDFAPDRSGLFRHAESGKAFSEAKRPALRYKMHLLSNPTQPYFPNETAILHIGQIEERSVSTFGDIS